MKVVIENMKVHEIIQGDFIKSLGTLETLILKECEEKRDRQETVRGWGKIRKRKRPWKLREELT